MAGDEFENGEINSDINSRIMCRYEYDAFGNTINAEETITNRYGFTGEVHDSITDMYYLRARYYAPDMGRLTQADTFHGDGLNLYVYAGNNPSHKNPKKRTGTGQAWFPESWMETDIKNAGEYVANLSENVDVPYGEWMFGECNGVRVGVIKNEKFDGIGIIIPDNSRQP